MKKLKSTKYYSALKISKEFMFFLFVCVQLVTFAS